MSIEEIKQIKTDEEAMQFLTRFRGYYYHLAKEQYLYSREQNKSISKSIIEVCQKILDATTP